MSSCMAHDYISRQAAIDNINDFIKKCYARGNDIRQYQEGLTHYVLNIPTADVRENVKGEWIEDNPREKSMMWRCSVCGRIAYYPTIGERKNYKKHCGYNFCPNCGAEMQNRDKS